MENKLNIAKLLKDCPKGMELDCTMYEDIYFDYVDAFNIIHCYIQHGTYKMSITFNQFGTPNSHLKSKCVIFPKGKTTWEGFVPPCQFKDGDVCCIKTEEFKHIFIFKVSEDYNYILKYANLSENNLYTDESPVCSTNCVKEIRYATKEEKQKLFDAIKANGYKWNSETKTLEKLIKFKIGDRIKHKNSRLCCTLGEYAKGISAYRTSIGLALTSKDLEQWELAPNKFDIITLKPFDKVLVRCNSLERWHIQFFEKYNRELGAKYPFICSCNSKYSQCVPYEGNKYLLDTTDDCDDFYKTWE